MSIVNLPALDLGERKPSPPMRPSIVTSLPKRTTIGFFMVAGIACPAITVAAYSTLRGNLFVAVVTGFSRAYW